MALVNDEPVTGFNVEQRARFLALSTNIGDRARERMKAFAQDPKTNERLKAILQETIAANRGKTREQIIAAFEVRKKAYVVSLQKQAVESARASVIPTMRKKALDELIEERLKLQEAKKLSIRISDKDVD
ncbi:MAG: peptidylprolyl isomerase, partial [Hyphomicrobiaceae bacterium]